MHTRMHSTHSQHTSMALQQFNLNAYFFTCFHTIFSIRPLGITVSAETPELEQSFVVLKVVVCGPLVVCGVLIGGP